MQALGTSRQFVAANEVFLTSHESCSLGPLQAACRSDVTSGPDIISGTSIETLLLRGDEVGVQRLDLVCNYKLASARPIDDDLEAPLPAKSMHCR
jgi:hypothetical protein